MVLLELNTNQRARKWQKGAQVHVFGLLNRTEVNIWNKDHSFETVDQNSPFHSVVLLLESMLLLRILVRKQKFLLEKASMLNHNKYSPLLINKNRKEDMTGVEGPCFTGWASSLRAGAVQWCRGQWSNCHIVLLEQQFHVEGGGRPGLEDLLQCGWCWRPLGRTQLLPATDLGSSSSSGSKN